MEKLEESVRAFTERRRSLRPRPYQQAAVDAALKAFEKGELTALIQAATGAGKTIMFSLLIRTLLSENPNLRIAILAHRRELVAQARDKLKSVYPEAEIGVACSSLERKRELECNVTIGSIQTLANQAELHPFDLIIVDEVHRLPTKDKSSQMRAFLNKMWEKNEKMNLLGVTATPFRLGHGYIYGHHCKAPEANWFEKRCYHIDIDQLQEEGFLSPYTFMVAETEIQNDLKNCAVDSFGEYATKQLEQTVVKQEHLLSAVKTLQAHALDRRSIVIFCVSIKHADKMKEAFMEQGILTASVHSEMSATERDDILEKFNEGHIRILTNVGVLTEGWDSPRADCIMLCRPTLSSALYVQMVGRGLRTFESKRDCLVLDLAGCFEKHGSVRHPIVQNHCGEFEMDAFESTSIERHCPHCKEVIPLSTISCPHCQAELKATVVTVDHQQTMIEVDESESQVIECDACQVPYRYDELEVEMFSFDPEAAPMGIHYCPHEHPMKAMEPAKSVEKSGEYELLHYDVKLNETSSILCLDCVFLNEQKNPYITTLAFNSEDTESLNIWLKKIGESSKACETLTDYANKLKIDELKKALRVTLTLTQEGCLLQFC